jgi:hypothetical protein
MTDHRKEIKPMTPREPDAIMSPAHGFVTPADLARAAEIARQQSAQEITIKVDSCRPEYRGDDLLRRFVPYFVITMMGLVMIGGIAAILAMVIPPIMALVITLVGSLVSIILSLVATVIVAVIAALGITFVMSINRRDEMEARRMDQE